jgi:hypothetical protein
MALAFDADLGSITNNASLTTGAAAAAGSRVFVFVWWYDATATLTSGSWGGGLSWVADHQFHGTIAGDQNIGIGSADAPSGLASSTAITPTFSAAVDFGPGIAAASFTGVETGASGYVDVTSTGKEDFEETWTTNNLVTTNADDLLLGLSVVDYTPGAHTATAPAAEIHEWNTEGAQYAASVYRIVSATSTYQVGGVWSATVAFQHNIGVAYKAAADEPPPTGAPETLRVVRGSMRYR